MVGTFGTFVHLTFCERIIHPPHGDKDINKKRRFENHRDLFSWSRYYWLRIMVKLENSSKKSKMKKKSNRK